MAGYRFLVTDGPDSGQTYSLGEGTTLVGRLDVPSPQDPEGSTRWTLTDPAVSRTHAQVEWDGQGAPVLIHLSSTNATLLDGRIVTGKSVDTGPRLKNGQVIRVGQTSMEVQQLSSKIAWGLQEGDLEPVHFNGTQPWENDGVLATSDVDGAQVLLVDPGSEAYVLRRLEGVLWTTPLRKEQPVSLQVGDILRLNERRLVVVDHSS